MIFAKLREAGQYRGIHPRLDRALALLTPDFLASVGAVRQEMEGEALFVTRFDYQTLPREETFFEAHRRYLDIHVMVEGCERVEIASPDRLRFFEHEGDFYGYRGEAEQSLLLSPGAFLVVFPDDAHRLKIAVDGERRVSKVVFKILVSEDIS